MSNILYGYNLETRKKFEVSTEEICRAINCDEKFAELLIVMKDFLIIILFIPQKKIEIFIIRRIKMFLVTYKIHDGEHEYHEYSWFSMGTQSDYDAGVIKDKILIEEVYGGEVEQEEGTNKYFSRDWDTFIQVYSVQDITVKELKMLSKFGIVSYDGEG